MVNESDSTKLKLTELILKQLDPQDSTPINIYEIRNYIYYGFNDEKVRPKYWKILLNYFPKNKFTTENFYKQARQSYIDISNQEINLETKNQIHNELFRNDFNEKEKEIFEKILFVFCTVNPCIGYVQGMEHLLKVIYNVLLKDDDIQNQKFIEEDTFCLFNNLISELSNNFIKESENQNIGIKYKIEQIYEIIKLKDPALYKILKKKKLLETMFPFRWVLMMFSMEYSKEKVAWLWDKILSDSYRFEILLYCAAAAIILMRDVLITEEYEKCVLILQKPSIISPELLFDIADTMRREDEDINEIIKRRINKN
jgi:hypothetical protein